MMKRYFIEKSQKSIANHPLFGDVENWKIIETVEYPDSATWESAMKQIGIPNVCWLIKEDVAWKAYVEYVK